MVRDLIDSLMMFWQLGSPSLRGGRSPPAPSACREAPALPRRPAACCVVPAAALAGPFSDLLGPAADKPFCVVVLP